MSHRISVVDDDALPDGHDFVFVNLPGGRAHIFYRRSALDVGPLMDSWAAYRATVRGPRPKRPTRAGDARSVVTSLIHRRAG